jgi:hypothetical protein
MGASRLSFSTSVSGEANQACGKPSMRNLRLFVGNRLPAMTLP